MAEATHYSLQVIRIRDVGRREAKLYVEVNLKFNGTTCRKTRAVNDDGTLDLSDTFSFSFSYPSAILRISLKESSMGRYFAYTEQEISSLPQGCYENPVKLSLSLTPRQKLLKKSQEHVGTVDLHLKAVDVLNMATCEVNAARQSIDHLEKRVDRRLYRCDVIGLFVEAAGTVCDAVSKAVGIPPVFELSQTLTLGLFKLVARQFEAEKELVDMVETMKNVFDFSVHTSNLVEKSETLERLLKNSLQDIVQCARFVQEYAGNHFFGRLLRFPYIRKIREYKDCFLEHRRCLVADIGLAVMQGVSSANVKLSDMDDKTTKFYQKSELLRLLVPDIFANRGDNLSGRRRCLEGTRTMYLQEIEQFASSGTMPSVLWLSGVAGSGKSTIALTALDELSDNLVYLFFERGKSTADNVVRALACDLAAVYPSVAPYIMSAAKADPNIKDKSLTLQFENLLLKPLLAADAASVLPDGVVFMLDALDECGMVEQRRDLLQLLNTDFPKLPNTRCIVTSRPEDDIVRELSSNESVKHVQLVHKSERGREDVRCYIRSEMTEMICGSVPPDEEWDAKMQGLSKAADGLFIWATTAVKMVRDAIDRHDAIETLLEDIRKGGASGLDGLYATALEGSEIIWKDPKWRNTFTSLIGLILVTKEALLSKDIAGFLGVKEDVVDRLLSQLRSLVNYERGHPVRLHHASFADYLLSPTRSEGKPWNINELDQRMAVTEKCFDVMNDNLRFNICRLETSFVRNEDIPDLQDRISQNIPAHLLYACRYWDVHICDLPPQDACSGLLGKLEHFLKCHLLHWFEVLSLTNVYNRIAGRALYEVTLRCTTTDTELSSFLWASYRLASAFAYPISQSAPQIYLSAVSLWKFESIVAKHYSTIYPTICVDRIGTKPPARYTQILRGSEGKFSAAFSSDGRRVAVCSWVPKGLRLELSVWDSDSGMRLSRNSLSNRHARWSITSFSHDIKHLAMSQFSGQAFSIWDVDSSKLVSGPFEGHDDEIVSLAFSPDCKYIASGSRDTTIRIWDASTGTLVSTLVGHEKAVSSVSFSPDGRYLASGSEYGAICIWDVHSGKLIGSPSKGHTDIVSSVTFSPNGEYVASGSRDSTVRIWNIDKGKLVPASPPLKGHRDRVVSVAFSPDSSYVAAGSEDGTTIWDVRTGARVCGPLRPNLGITRSVSFSPDGRRVMSCHFKGICVWDFDSCKINTVTSKTPSVEHTRTVTSVAFSPDGKYTASGSEDNTIRVWNAVTGEPVLHLKGHTDTITSVAFSSDGTRIVSGSEDKTVRVWDTITGDLVLPPFEGHTDEVTLVAFLSDRTSIVSRSRDGTICVWNADSGAPLIDHSNVTHCLEQIGTPLLLFALSSDGRSAVSVNFSGMTCIWDLTSGVIVSETFLGRGYDVVALSSDRSRVVLCRGSRVGLFDVNSGRLLDEFKGYTEPTACAFSPDGRFFVTGYRDLTIRIWRLKSELDYTGEFAATVSSSSPSSIGETGPGYWSDDGDDSSIVDVKSRTRKSLLSNWTLSEDGWVLSERGELLTWIPEDMRATLWRPRNTAVLSQFSTKLDFVNSPIGPGWPEGFSLPDS